MAAEASGWRIVELAELAHESGAVVGRDEGRGVDEVDVDLLRAALSAELRAAGPEERVLIVGHLSHLMPCDLTVVLRCSPAVLRERLAARDYPPEKIRENVEAEAVDVVLVEALDMAPHGGVYEIDTSKEPLEVSLSSLLAVIEGNAEAHKAGNIDWSAEVMDWF
jgi:adenylate kinase